jgi:phage terminase Nu1 subunit (DNA packaging protein)
MALTLTGSQLAESLGVLPVTVEHWREQGCPAVVDADGTPAQNTLKGRRWWRVSRRRLAALMDVHADTLTHRQWLAAAVIEPGGRGKEKFYDVRRAVRAEWEERGFMKSVREEDRAMRAALAAVLSQAQTAKGKRAKAGARGERP